MRGGIDTHTGYLNEIVLERDLLDDAVVPEGSTDEASHCGDSQWGFGNAVAVSFCEIEGGKSRTFEVTTHPIGQLRGLTLRPERLRVGSDLEALALKASIASRSFVTSKPAARRASIELSLKGCHVSHCDFAVARVG
jgi:hypothetical protein